MSTAKRDRAIVAAAARKPGFSPMLVRNRVATVAATRGSWHRHGDTECFALAAVLSDGRVVFASMTVTYEHQERERAMDFLAKGDDRRMVALTLRRSRVMQAVRGIVQQRHAATTVGIAC